MTIIDCGIESGYHYQDHLDSEWAAKMAIGRRARTLGEAIRIVWRTAAPGNYTGSPVWVRCRTDQGDEIFGTGGGAL